MKQGKGNFWERGKKFFEANRERNWPKIFENKNDQEHRETLNYLKAYEKIIRHQNSITQSSEIREFINDYEVMSKEIMRYQKLTKKAEASRKWKMTKELKELKSEHRIQIPYTKNRIVYQKESNQRANRSISSGSALSRSRSGSVRERKLFDCLTRLCPRFGRKRGSNRRMNPTSKNRTKQLHSSSKKQKKANPSSKNTKNAKISEKIINFKDEKSLKKQVNKISKKESDREDNQINFQKEYQKVEASLVNIQADDQESSLLRSD